MGSSLSELKKLRVTYEAELADRKAFYSIAVKEAKSDYERSQKIDFVDEEKLRFEMSLESLEDLYQDLLNIYAKTKGLTFSITKHIVTVTPRPVPFGEVYAYFDRIVEDCNGALDEIERSSTPEQDIKPIKAFCQGLVDLRYVVKNVRQLILDTGDTQRRKAEILDKKRQEISNAEREFKEQTLLENFDCYPELMKFRNKVIEESKIIEESMLANRPISPRNDHKFLMGFYVSQIPKDDLNFAEKVLDIPTSCFAQDPIYFNLEADHTCLLINAPKLFFTKSEVFFNDKTRKLEFYKLLVNLYFSFVSNMPAKGLLFGGVEPEEGGTSHVSALELRIKKDLENALFKDVRRKVDGTTDSIPELFEELNKLCEDRATSFIDVMHSDIFSFNEENPASAEHFVLFAVNRYPYGLNTSRFNGRDELIKLATQNGNFGAISIIFQESDANFTAEAPMLTAEELNADVIDFHADGSVTYNGKKATLDVCVPNFNIPEYFKEIAKYLQGASSISLFDILDRENKKKEEQKRAEKTGKLAPHKRLVVPMGESRGEPFNFTMKSCSTESFALLVGTAGSGKSSFLHTFILSVASKYSPDEIQFGLIDFKSDEDSPEFSQYKRIPGKDNLYIPHVNYLMVNGKPECAVDLFSMLSDIKKERSKMFTALGVSELSAYNEHPRVVSGELPKLPILFFIIDEYNVMLEGDGTRDRNINRKIVTALTSTIKLVRACGIGIMLSGQSVATGIMGEEGALAQMNTRISLYTNSIEGYTSLMGSNNVPSRDAKADVDYLRDKGFSIFTTDAGRTRTQVRHAYAGNTGCKKQLDLARKIREKYGDNTQLVAGAETLYPISHDKKGVANIGICEGSDFQIPIGVSSASMKPQGLEYSSEKDSLGYFALASAEQLNAIEINAILSFIATVEEHKLGNEKVVYIGDGQSYEGHLDEYVEKFKPIGDRVELAIGAIEGAKKLIEIYDLVEEREKQANAKKGAKPDPKFVVLRDIEWLSDDENSWISELNTPEKAEVKAVPNPDLKPVGKVVTVEDLLKEKPGLAALPLPTLEAMAKQATYGKQTTTIKPEVKQGEKKRRITIDLLRNMLKKIYERGNRVNVFVIITGETIDAFKKVVLDKISESNRVKAQESFAVYASQNEYVNPNKRDEDCVKDCVYVCPSESKTRLFDYSIENNKAWWDAFIKKLEK